VSVHSVPDNMTNVNELDEQQGVSYSSERASTETVTVSQLD